MTATRQLVWLWLAVAAVCLPSAGSPASDRGIGGTGAPASGPAISDRGIGGTGIVGVITGFGSVFVDGLEVAYTPGTPLTVDGEPEAGAEPRVGQLATIVASDDNGLRAVSIDLRHEVSGPVTSVGPTGVSPNGVSRKSPDGAGSDGPGPDGGSPKSPDGETFVVSGQTVAIDSATEGLRTVHPGDWVAVSGLREPDGVIAATRIDQRSPGTILVRGTAMPGPEPGPGGSPSLGGWRIGELPVQPPSGAAVAPGANITVRGRMLNGELSDTTVDPDVLSSDPAAFFGGHVRRMVIESYVSAAGGHVRFGRGWLAEPGRGVLVPAGAHRAIVQLERGAQGGFVATHLRRARPAAPYRGDRHGGLERPHAGARRFGPGRVEDHPWGERHWDRGRGGFMGRRFGRGRGPR